MNVVRMLLSERSEGIIPHLGAALQHVRYIGVYFTFGANNVPGTVQKQFGRTVFRCTVPGTYCAPRTGIAQVMGKRPVHRLHCILSCATLFVSELPLRLLGRRRCGVE